MPVGLLLLATHATNITGELRHWGLTAIDRIERDFAVGDHHLYGEAAQLGHRPTAVAFNWGVGVMLQALNSAARADSGEKRHLAEFVTATKAYWNPKPPVPGFDVLPGPKPADRYYDDNEWMILGLVEASKTLHSRKALTRAKEAFRFVQSGEDHQLGGGVYWRENGRTSKNTCSNAPAVAAALALYSTTKQRDCLSFARRVYTWTQATLRDPVDGLYWDSVDLKSKFGKDKWSYNSGLMLQDAAELYAITKDEAYANDARQLMTATLKHWVAPDGSLRDDGKFMFLLLDAWHIAHRLVPNIEDPRPAIRLGLSIVHSRTMDSEGHYPTRWDAIAPTVPYKRINLIDQAAAARAFLEAAANP